VISHLGVWAITSKKKTLPPVSALGVSVCLTLKTIRGLPQLSGWLVQCVEGKGFLERMEQAFLFNLERMSRSHWVLPGGGVGCEEEGNVQ